jgi:predicted nucleic acid-binding protein
MDYLIDTSFLIRRWRGREASAEQRFIDQNPEAVIGLPWVVKAEFLRGAVLAGHDLAMVREFLDRYPVAWLDEQVIDLYARTYVELALGNRMIGPHDLWIAATGLRLRLPLLTANVREFKRVPNLAVVDYRENG